MSSERKCDHPTLYMQSWRGVEAYEGCPLCRLQEQSTLLDQHREWTDSAQNAALRAQKERDDALSRLDTIRRTIDECSPGAEEWAIGKIETILASGVEKPSETFVEKALGGSNQLYRTLVEIGGKNCDHVYRTDLRICAKCAEPMPANWNQFE